MVRENRMDRITDKLKLRVNRIIGSAQKQFKGTNPYRQEPVPDEERIQRYLQIDPEMEGQMRQEFGDQLVDKMHFRMQELMSRRARDARL